MLLFVCIQQRQGAAERRDRLLVSSQVLQRSAQKEQGLWPRPSLLAAEEGDHLGIVTTFGVNQRAVVENLQECVS